MAALTRYTQELFGTDAGANEMAEFGSLVTDPPGNLYSGATITPAIVQNSTAFKGGLYAAVGGAYSPTIQDMNSVLYDAFYQLTYILQNGVPGWDAATTYYTNQFCSLSGVIYVSLVDNNLNNNPASSPSDWATYTNSNVGPTIQKFTSGSGTYTLPTSPRKPLYIRVRMAGGGGGGGGSSTAASGSAGSTGGNTTFGTTLLVANGGVGGGPDQDGAVGGTASLGSGPIGLAYQGGKGGDSANSAGATSTAHGGNGGSNALGGNGTAGGSNGTVSSAGNDAIAGTGGGGGGGGAGAAGVVYSGSGGGAGGFIDAIINSPASSYAYAVGAGGGGGLAGTDGAAGGAGGSGIIEVTEYYQ
jgi:hypothetical protein